MRVWDKIMRRHRAKLAEEHAIEQAQQEMLRAGVDEEPKRDILGNVYAWLKGGGV